MGVGWAGVGVCPVAPSPPWPGRGKLLLGTRFCWHLKKNFHTVPYTQRNLKTSSYSLSSWIRPANEAKVFPLWVSELWPEGHGSLATRAISQMPGTPEGSNKSVDGRHKSIVFPFKKPSQCGSQGQVSCSSTEKDVMLYRGEEALAVLGSSLPRVINWITLCPSLRAPEQFWFCNL